MNRPRFGENVLLAVVFSLVVSAAVTVRSGFFPTRWLLNMVITAIGFAYVVYLLYRSREKTGRVAVVTVWLGVALLIWLFSPSMLISLFLHTGVIWLIRALYYHNSVLIALLDLGLVVAGIGVSLWTLLHTHSLLLSVWVFFLIQALFTLLPESIAARKSVRSKRQPDDSFETAYQAAQSALRNLSTQP